MRLSLPHPLNYEVGMSKAPAITCIILMCQCVCVCVCVCCWWYLRSTDWKGTTEYRHCLYKVFVFVFVFLLSLKPRPFVQSFFDRHAPRYSHTHFPLITCVYVIFFCFVYVLFLYFGDVAFSEYFVTFIAVSSVEESTSYVFPLPGGVFSTL